MWYPKRHKCYKEVENPNKINMVIPPKVFTKAWTWKTLTYIILLQVIHTHIAVSWGRSEHSWVKIAHSRPRTPHWDIKSSCNDWSKRRFLEHRHWLQGLDQEIGHCLHQFKEKMCRHQCKITALQKVLKEKLQHNEISCTNKNIGNRLPSTSKPQRIKTYKHHHWKTIEINTH